MWKLKVRPKVEEPLQKIRILYELHFSIWYSLLKEFLVIRPCVERCIWKLLIKTTVKMSVSGLLVSNHRNNVLFDKSPCKIRNKYVISHIRSRKCLSLDACGIWKLQFFIKFHVPHQTFATARMSSRSRDSSEVLMSMKWAWFLVT